MIWDCRSQVGRSRPTPLVWNHAMESSWGSRPTPLASNRAMESGWGSRPTPLAWHRHSQAGGAGVGLLHWLEIATVRLGRRATTMAWDCRSQVGRSRPTPLAWNHAMESGWGSRPTPLAWNRQQPGWVGLLHWLEIASSWSVGLLQWLEIAAVRLEGVGLLHWLQTAPWSQAGRVGLYIATVRRGGRE